MTYSDREEWIESDPFSYTKLHNAGYAVGGYLDDDGKQRYVLYQVERKKNGDFRKVHGVNPPTKLIRLHDRGIRITTTHLRNNGIRVA